MRRRRKKRRMRRKRRRMQRRRRMKRERRKKRRKRRRKSRRKYSTTATCILNHSASGYTPAAFLHTMNIPQYNDDDEVGVIVEKEADVLDDDKEKEEVIMILFRGRRVKLRRRKITATCIPNRSASGNMPTTLD